MKGRAAFVATFLTLASPATAQLYCSPPPEPSCMAALGLARDDFAFQMCRNEVEAYRDAVRRYINCLREEESAIIQRLNAVIERFNNCARSDLCW